MRFEITQFLTHGKTPNFDQMVDNLRLLNENPAKQATVVMRAGEGEGEVDAAVRATDQPPIRYAVTFDNTGNTQTGPFRIGAAVQHANLFDSDHVVSFQAITSPLRAQEPGSLRLIPCRKGGTGADLGSFLRFGHPGGRP